MSNIEIVRKTKKTFSLSSFNWHGFVVSNIVFLFVDCEK